MVNHDVGDEEEQNNNTFATIIYGGANDFFFSFNVDFFVSSDSLRFFFFLQVRTITALALSSLAEAAHPYGIESFDRVLRPLWKGIRTHRGKGLAAFLKAIGFVIPLMDATYANYYTREVMVILIREFQVCCAYVRCPY